MHTILYFFIQQGIKEELKSLKDILNKVSVCADRIIIMNYRERLTAACYWATVYPESAAKLPALGMAWHSVTSHLAASWRNSHCGACSTSESCSNIIPPPLFFNILQSVVTRFPPASESIIALIEGVFYEKY
jgi:hypothetical protein